MEYIVIIGSGPSLSDDDVAICKNKETIIIAVNTSWSKIIDCDYIYAGDFLWWEHNYHLIDSKADLWTCNHRAHKKFGINLHTPRYGGSYNSGMRAIQFAISLSTRKKKIILLGFDCSLKQGSHWHGDHENTSNPTSGTVMVWHKQFYYVSTILPRNVDVINCSRYSELTCFSRGNLVTELAGCGWRNNCLE